MKTKLTFFLFFSLLRLAGNKHFISTSSSASLAMTKTPEVEIILQPRRVFVIARPSI